MSDPTAIQPGFDPFGPRRAWKPRAEHGPAANNAISYWGNGATHQVNLGGGGLSQTFSYNHRFWPSSVTATAGGSSLQREGT